MSSVYKIAINIFLCDKFILALIKILVELYYNAKYVPHNIILFNKFILSKLLLKIPFVIKPWKYFYFHQKPDSFKSPSEHIFWEFFQATIINDILS